MRFSDQLLARLIPKKENSVTDSKIEFQKAVAEAVQKQEEDKKKLERFQEYCKDKKKLERFQEYCKQYPKATITLQTKSSYSGEWEVGDWVVMDSMVYEIVDAASVTTKSAPSLYGLDLETPEKWGSQSETVYKWKLRTIPLQGQKAVEGWLTIPQQYVQVYYPNGHTQGPTYTILKRNLSKPTELSENPV